jgi:hypothetical protein
MSDTIMKFDEKLSSFLTKKELEIVCPVAFKDTPTNPNLSKKYIHANTSTVIDDLEKLGWFPTEAKQRLSNLG